MYSFRAVVIAPSIHLSASTPDGAVRAITENWRAISLASCASLGAFTPSASIARLARYKRRSRVSGLIPWMLGVLREEAGAGVFLRAGASRSERSGASVAINDPGVSSPYDVMTPS